MSYKDIQKERVRRYFLEAAKDIILTEGVSAVTSKKVGEKAAYSYASIYNYFENQNALLCEAVEEIARDCAQWVRDNLEAVLSGQFADFQLWIPYGSSELQNNRLMSPEDRILAFSFLMIEYNGKNPNRYAPFISTEIDFRYFIRRDGNHFMHPAYALLLGELEKLDKFTQDKRRLIADIMVYIFHSKMHFYIRYGAPESLEALHKEVAQEVRFLLWP
ncbi:TetR/AcrR family transcriptional regulator [Gracilinema caldarium]|uniref:TetR/AcrR family transcriptional regulator n=1 Tax=Gracilinema caldarium TaxID=215591 RepID=UPI0026EF78BB|nr:TetR/AcrR family transcriptional regulator [Gracilinema caldarium]